MLKNVEKYIDPKYNIMPLYTFGFDTFRDIDIVHLHNIATTAIKRKLFFLKSCKIKKYKRIKDRPYFIGGVRGWIGFQKSKNFLKYFDSIHVSNIQLLNEVKKINPNCYLIYPGIDTEIFRPLSKESDEFVIGWAGDKNKKMKNFHLLYKLGYPLKIATKENYIPHKDMPQFYNSLSVYTYFSSHEGCNRTLLEAAACGLPIISTNAGAVRQLLSPEWIVDIDPSEELKVIKEFKKRLKMFESNPELMREVGSRNREAALRWDWKVIVKEIEEMFDKTMFLDKSKNEVKK